MTDTYTNLKTALESYFNTSWAGETPVEWPLVGFDPPAGSPWVRYQEVPLDDRFQSLGSINGKLMSRVDAAIVITIFTPLRESAKIADELVDRVMDIFRGVEIAGALFRHPRRQTPLEDNGWWQSTVICEFQFDHVN